MRDTPGQAVARRGWERALALSLLVLLLKLAASAHGDALAGEGFPGGGREAYPDSLLPEGRLLGEAAECAVGGAFYDAAGDAGEGAGSAAGVWPAMIAVYEAAGEKEESRLRRGEIVFFISLPVSILFSLLGVVAFRAANGESGDYSSIEYTYIALSSVGISLSVAVSDSRVKFGRTQEKRGQ